MAYLNITGAETGDFSEASGTAGTVDVSTTHVRTGTYAYHLGASATSDAIDFRALAASGVPANLAATPFTTCYIYVGTLPSNSINTFYFGFYAGASGANKCMAYKIATDGKILDTQNGNADTGFTVATGQFYRFELSASNAGTCGLKMNGSAEYTSTGAAQNPNYFSLVSGANTSEVWVDDIAISDSAYPGAGEVHMSVPIGAGNYAAWSTGAYTDVDEVPHDSGTTVIVSGTGAGLLADTYDMQTAATAGIVGTIATVKLLAIMNEAASTTTSGGIRLRSATTDADTTTVDIGNTTYVPIAKLWDTDPADAAAWTSTKYDAIEGGVYRAAADTSSIQATAIYVMVWCTGATPAMLFPKISRVAVRRASYH